MFLRQLQHRHRPCEHVFLNGLNSLLDGYQPGQRTGPIFVADKMELTWEASIEALDWKTAPLSQWCQLIFRSSARSTGITSRFVPIVGQRPKWHVCILSGLDDLEMVFF